MLLRRIKLFFKYFHQKLFFFCNRICFSFSLHRRGEKNNLVVPIGFKKYISKMKYIIVLISLFSSFYIFDNVFFAFLFNIFIFLISLSLERILFPYTTVFLHPLNDFDLQPDKWEYMGFGWTNGQFGYLIPLVIMGISDDDYGRKLYNLFLRWTVNNTIDEKRFVSASVTIMDDNSYVFYIYPNMNRDEKLGTYDGLLRKVYDKFPNLVHRRIIGELYIGKRISISDNSSFWQFKEKYSKNIPVLFIIENIKNGTPVGKPIKGTEPLVICDFKIKNIDELSKDEPEYSLLKMGKPISFKDIIKNNNN